MKVLAIKNNKNGKWFIHCGMCGKYLEKNWYADELICECGWKWHGVDTGNKREDIKIGLIEIDK